MKRVLGILLLSLLFFSYSHALVLETIDAVVNDELILSGEVDYLIKDTARRLDKFVIENNVATLPASVYQELRPKILGKLIDDHLVFQAIRGNLNENDLTLIREDSLRKTDLAMEEFRTKYNTAEKMLEQEKRQGMTWEEIRQANYQSFYNENIQKVVISQVINRRVAKPTQEDLDDFVKRFPNDLPTGEITIQQIQLNVPPNATPEEEKAILQKAQEILLRARGGDSFDYLVYYFSQHAASRSQGGMITFNKGTLYKEFDPVFDLNVGDITEPIRTPVGYHIIRVVAKDTLESRVLKIKRNIELSQWLDELRKNAKIERRASNFAPASQTTN